ncbi:hypothetical protein [Brotaphodocola sp.]|uniref:hypothetical protein n=1 Tax=Brotaphodocola sp. TaxID=3073577 RepID=UPI003D7C6C20
MGWIRVEDDERRGGENICGQSIQRQNLLPKSQGFTVPNKILTLYNGSRGQVMVKNLSQPEMICKDVAIHQCEDA